MTEEEIRILEDERVDDLMRNGYRIIQNRKKFCFGMDAVLLSGFARAEKGERTLDLGTGTGIIPLLMAAKTRGESFAALEIQPDMADMAGRSVALNGLEKKITVVTGDIKEASEIFGRASFDVVTCNPPYMDQSHGLRNPDEPRAIARHELLCTFEDVAREAAAVLRPGGRFYLVHRPRRLAELICVLKNHRLEPKRMKLVYPYLESEANMVLLEAVRGGGVQLRVEPPLVVYERPGVYTREIYDIYGY